MINHTALNLKKLFVTNGWGSFYESLVYFGKALTFIVLNYYDSEQLLWYIDCSFTITLFVTIREFTFYEININWNVNIFDNLSFDESLSIMNQRKFTLKDISQSSLDTVERSLKSLSMWSNNDPFLISWKTIKRYTCLFWPT